MLLDNMVDMYFDKIKDVYPEGPYITEISESRSKHIHFTIKKNRFKDLKKEL